MDDLYPFDYGVGGSYDPWNARSNAQIPGMGRYALPGFLDQPGEATQPYSSPSQVPGTQGAPQETPSATPGGVNSGRGTGGPASAFGYGGLARPRSLDRRSFSEGGNAMSKRGMTMGMIGMGMLAPPRPQQSSSQTPYGINYAQMMPLLRGLQEGGDVQGNEPVVVGEQGPETFFPNQQPVIDFLRSRPDLTSDPTSAASIAGAAAAGAPQAGMGDIATFLSGRPDLTGDPTSAASIAGAQQSFFNAPAPAAPPPDAALAPLLGALGPAAPWQGMGFGSQQQYDISRSLYNNMYGPAYAAANPFESLPPAQRAYYAGQAIPQLPPQPLSFASLLSSGGTKIPSTGQFVGGTPSINQIQQLAASWGMPFNAARDIVRQIANRGIFVPGMQYGGYPQAGEPVLVGERGPEIFVPNMPGTIVPMR